MSSAQRLYHRTLAVALLGVLAVVLPVVVAVRAVELTPPSRGALVEACGRLISSGLDVASVMVLVLTLLVTGVLLLSARSLLRQLRGHRRFMQTLVRADPGAVRLPGATIIDDLHPKAFCAGYLRPRVFVSTGALERLSRPEVGAVLAHEHHHRLRRDPLRLLLLRTLADAFFFLPALHSLGTRYAALAEVAADEAAIRARGRKSLASALLSFGQGPSPDVVVGIAPERVEHLLGRGRDWRLPASILCASLVALAGVAALALGTASITAGTPISVLTLLMHGCWVALVALPLGAVATLLLGRRPSRVSPGV